jgi:hypothetical protein
MTLRPMASRPPRPRSAGGLHGHAPDASRGGPQRQAGRAGRARACERERECEGEREREDESVRVRVPRTQQLGAELLPYRLEPLAVT